jgi:uncharacterized protein YecE (DUF72 family)
VQHWIGTSGYQYPEWKGTFYPEKLSIAKMLGYYSERFPSTEVNYTFRHFPSAKTIARWLEETPAAFRFSLKAPQRITHFAKLRNCGEILHSFHDAIGSLAPKLDPILFQLPPNFRKDTPLLVEFLGNIPPGMRAAFEFREPGWFSDDVFEALKLAGAALCIAESDTLATPPVATADFGYLRLRRADYQSADIARWAQWTAAQSGQWQDAFTYFKHEESGSGPKFATAFREQLSSS